jgi:hypothetical protein
MARHFHWFLPTNGDGRDIVGGGHGVATGSAGTIRPASLGYLGQVARSAEQLGFEAALTPTGAWCEDAWLVTGMLTEVTERLNFIVAFRPGLISPMLAAQMAATRPLAASSAGQRGRPRRHDTVRAHVRSRSLGRCVVTRCRAERRRYHVPARARAHLDRRQTPCASR